MLGFSYVSTVNISYFPENISPLSHSQHLNHPIVFGFLCYTPSTAVKRKLSVAHSKFHVSITTRPHCFIGVAKPDNVLLEEASSGFVVRAHTYSHPWLGQSTCPPCPCLDCSIKVGITVSQFVPSNKCKRLLLGIL